MNNPNEKDFDGSYGRDGTYTATNALQTLSHVIVYLGVTKTIPGHLLPKCFVVLYSSTDCLNKHLNEH